MLARRGQHELAGHGSSGLRITIAQSMRAPKRSKQSMTSSVKPFAGPGATPRLRVRPSSRSACSASQTTGLV